MCVCVYVCFFLFVKRSTYICRPLHKYKIDTCVSTSFSVHLNVCIVKMAGGQVDSVELTWVKLMLRASTRRQAPATVIPSPVVGYMSDWVRLAYHSLGVCAPELWANYAQPPSVRQTTNVACILSSRPHPSTPFTRFTIMHACGGGITVAGA